MACRALGKLLHQSFDALPVEELLRFRCAWPPDLRSQLRLRWSACLTGFSLPGRGKGALPDRARPLCLLLDDLPAHRADPHEIRLTGVWSHMESRSISATAAMTSTKKS
jgi:hypothetical protein